ncbi:unnamed protein product [Caenorhabditis auriculariae]|uniref:THUMP domain-containing protein n=1 Tax=Caenorhabditis auriculariae TaxID=2777116 RepID=A0A8S1H3B9_9PELO|nr:unnamed protein product [Caenorhabditis auriculariae]
MASNDRKRKHTRWNNKVKQKSVEAGVSGLFFTCDGREKDALHEAYCIIDELLENTSNGISTEKEEVKEENSGDESEEDIADALKKACDDERTAKTPGNKKERRCKQRPTGVKNCLFIAVKDADAILLAEKMVDLTQKSPRCRHLQRVLPVESTAEIDLQKLNDLVAAAISKYLVKKSDDSWPTYSLEFKARNNDSISKGAVLEMLDDAILAFAPGAKCSLSGAEVTLFVQVVRTTMMVGVCRDFYGRRKYSMRPAGPDTKNE